MPCKADSMMDQLLFLHGYLFGGMIKRDDMNDEGEIDEDSRSNRSTR